MTTLDNPGLLDILAVLPRHARAACSRARALFAEREIFYRSGGEVRFVRVSSRLQIIVASLVAAGLALWLALTAIALLGHASAAGERDRLDREAARVRASEARVDAYSHGAAGLARELERRQSMVEQLVKSRLGEVGAAPPPATPASRQTSAALPDAAQLRALEARQEAATRALAASFDARATRAAAALRAVGLDPDAILARSRGAQGGPLLPWTSDPAALTPAMRALVESVARWNVLEDNLVAIPSNLPTQGQMVTSSYGVRIDPFTHSPAFHPGLDFVGGYGQPIVAAAAGTVAYVGDRTGYGHVVEIDHGNGILTRYAHLSGFDTHVGAVVKRGERIARMGSTGRSTGTHLHFEVRVNGAPVNPRRYLEADTDVQQAVAVRSGDARHRS